MTKTTDQTVLKSMIEALIDDARHCSFIVLEPDLDSRKLRIGFRGRFICGINQLRMDEVEPEFCDEQEVELTFPATFPSTPPQIQWLTKLFHPNIPRNGHVHLPDIELAWNAHMSLSVLCERLWDVARYAFIATEDPANSSAGNWLGQNLDISIPLDERRFEKPKGKKINNIFRYRLKDESPSPHGAFTNPKHHINDEQDILYID